MESTIRGTLVTLFAMTSSILGLGCSTTNAPNLLNKVGVVLPGAYRIDHQRPKSTRRDRVRDLAPLGIGYHAELFTGHPHESQAALAIGVDYREYHSRKSSYDEDSIDVIIGPRYYLLPDRALRPYAALDVRFANFLAGGSKTGFDPQIGIDPGGGLSYWFSQNWMLDVSARYEYPLVRAASTRRWTHVRHGGGRIRLEGWDWAIRVGFCF